MTDDYPTDGKKYPWDREPGLPWDGEGEPKKKSRSAQRAAAMMAMGAGGYGLWTPGQGQSAIAHYKAGYTTMDLDYDTGEVLEVPNLIDGTYPMVGVQSVSAPTIAKYPNNRVGIQFNGIDQFLEAAGAPAVSGPFEIWIVFALSGASDMLMSNIQIATNNAFFVATVSQGAPFESDLPHLLRLTRSATNEITCYDDREDVTAAGPPVQVAGLARDRIARSTGTTYGGPIIFEIAIFDALQPKQVAEALYGYFHQEYLFLGK